jgi:DNA-binding XRE family transcriptional regulator
MDKWSLIKTLEKHKLTQYALAKIMGITRQAIYQHVERERKGLTLDHGFELKVKECLRKVARKSVNNA